MYNGLHGVYATSVNHKLVGHLNDTAMINIEVKLSEVHQRQFYARQSMPLTYLKCTNAYLLPLFFNIGFYE